MWNIVDEKCFYRYRLIENWNIEKKPNANTADINGIDGKIFKFVHGQIHTKIKTNNVQLMLNIGQRDRISISLPIRVHTPWQESRKIITWGFGQYPIILLSLEK